MSECTECDPKVLRLAARLARREARLAARLDAKGERQARKTARAVARASGCPTLLGLPWEQVEGFVAMAISHADGKLDELDALAVARRAWGLIEGSGLIPASLRKPVAGLVIEFVLLPMVARAIEAGIEWVKAKTAKAKGEVVGKLEALLAQPDELDEGEAA